MRKEESNFDMQNQLAMNMKKMMTVVTCLLTLLACAKANDDKVIGANELPQEAQNFITQHFSDKTIALVKVDKDFFDKTYEVKFTDRCEVEFNSRGEWKEVDCKRSEVPAGIIPDFIRTNLAQLYPNAIVWKIDRDEKKYEVELNDRTELKYPREDVASIKIGDLPQTAQNFINTHFAGKTVSFIHSERNLLGTEYDVTFANGDKVEFDSKGEWEEVDCRYSEVPAAIVPQQIRDDINAKYPNAKILEIDRDFRGYEVKLSNRMELEYNRNFQLVDID